MYSKLTLPRLTSFRGTSNGPSRNSTSDGHPWMSTQYFKFKLITDDSIDVIANMFLQNMTPEGQLLIKYDFMSAAYHMDDVSDLIDEQTCVKKAITLRYVYTDRFDTYIEDTTRYRCTLDKLVDHWYIQ
ncbi:19380_t:CDS:2, partial [Dentiscutata erythropus]